jgi:hypothetical protein
VADRVADTIRPPIHVQYSTGKTIRDIGRKISEVMEKGREDEKILDFKVS